MKMFNAAGQAVYFNQISKNGKTQYVVKALSGQHIKGRVDAPATRRRSQFR